MKIILGLTMSVVVGGLVAAGIMETYAGLQSVVNLTLGG